MKTLRKIKYFKRILIDKGNKEFEPGKEFVDHAIFHDFGNDYEEFSTDSGDTLIGNFSIAIIELNDGTIKYIEPELIQFIDVNINLLSD